MQCQAGWVVIEVICRFLGISTTAVLIGVGIETLQQGQFPSLAYYLFCQKEPSLYVYLGKTARMGGFQKFVGYGLLSVACFLHPVLVWHVTIPGTMLVVTGLAYLVLSKRKKNKDKECISQTDYYTDPSTTDVALTRAGDTEQTYTFTGNLKEKRESLLTQMRSILKVKKDQPLSKSQGPDKSYKDVSVDISPKKKQVHFEEKVIKIIPAEEGILDDQDSEVEDTTSDTVPIIVTEPKHAHSTLPMTPGIF
ncbi:transmembrane protein 72 isoform X2 [Hyla sarda]|uniref:transmembrane protein 72 isoform X2 n=1 Tax=Hyla sarda TaxID=327740 RepID=UPI0024C47133|nr:transmembrane protein 72 isoform X2 [Hyla sarda]